jgi:hypothetical protein
MVSFFNGQHKARSVVNVAVRVFLLATGSLCVAQAPAPLPVLLTIGSHSRPNASDAEIDQILQAVNLLYRCGRPLQRSGPARRLPATINDIVGNKAEMDRLSSLPENIKVVSQIDLCKTSDGTIRYGNYLGCVWTNNAFSIIVTKTPFIGVDVVTWAHETGHARGLGHQHDAPLALMSDGVLNAQSRNVSKGECDVISQY